MAPSDGDQLLFEGFGLTALARAPWGGRSPRVLTAGYQRGILKAQAAKSVSDFISDEQYDLWLPGKKAPWKYQGAPLLGTSLSEGGCDYE